MACQEREADALRHLVAEAGQERRTDRGAEDVPQARVPEWLRHVERLDPPRGLVRLGAAENVVRQAQRDCGSLEVDARKEKARL